MLIRSEVSALLTDIVTQSGVGIKSLQGTAHVVNRSSTTPEAEFFVFFVFFACAKAGPRGPRKEKQSSLAMTFQFSLVSLPSS